MLQKPAAKRPRKNSKTPSKADEGSGNDAEEDFDEGTPPPSDNSEDEVGHSCVQKFIIIPLCQK